LDLKVKTTDVYGVFYSLDNDSFGSMKRIELCRELHHIANLHHTHRIPHLRAAVKDFLADYVEDWEEAVARWSLYSLMVDSVCWLDH
jgi:hypothetical protein